MMRQLEHALGLLAERGEPVPVDVLVGRLEAQLAAEGTVPDTATAPGQDVPLGPTTRDGLDGRRRRNPWRGPLIAAGTAVAILVVVSLSLLFIGNGTGDVVIQPAPATSMPVIQEDITAVSAPIATPWSRLGTVDDWLTEPVLFNGTFYATRKGLEEGSQEEVDGQVHGVIEDVGELWTSPDGLTWMPADEGERPPPTSPDAATDGSAVVVRRNPTADLYGLLVAEGLWATSDGTSWREIELRPSQDNWIPSVASGELGWVVYSPPREATVEADGSSAYEGWRNGNLGLWYTPDTETWFEVTDLGPLPDTINADNIHTPGEVGVLDAAMIVRDTDILMYVNIAKVSGFAISNPHTEIWRLDPSAGQPTTITASPTTTLDLPTATTVAIEIVGWNTVLAETRAKNPPTPATCPPSATPNAPGPSDQARPRPGWVGNLAGAFDQHTGRIVYVDTGGRTWTFDVCTNTWHQMNPPPTKPIASGILHQLVYDIDSDVTIALGGGAVWVYDANTNTWSERNYPPGAPGLLGAVYDPISGLVITSTNRGGEDWDLWTYDVDTDTWTLLGTVTVDRGTPCCTQIDLLGYSTVIDSLILTTYIGSNPTTILTNPRTGDSTAIATGGATGIVNLGWPSGVYGPGGDTVYVYPASNGAPGISGFDSATSTWSEIEIPADVPNRYAAFGAVAGDPINNRLVLINGIHGEWWSDATDDIWAIDLATGEWTQVLAPSSP